MRRFSKTKRALRLATVLGVCLAGAGTSLGIIHFDTGDPALYTTTPGDNSGWQYEGQFGAYLGTPIAPLYFLTAKHIGRASDTFVFHAETFNVVAGGGYGDPSTDLQIWKVDHPFAVYAPIYQPGDAGRAEAGQELRVFGCGTQRGAEIYLGGTLRGWGWGGSDSVERWGRNLVSDVVSNGPGWTLLRVAFDSPGVRDESHLSVGDSGGGTFILQNGLWRLAGINYAVDDVFTAPTADTGVILALFDARGYYAANEDHTFSLITGDTNVPTSFYCTQVSARLAWIESVVGTIGPLPAENFAAWQKAYFAPDQITDDTFTGPNADPDGDGVANLLEFAFNLDPTFPEPVVMDAGTGLRGLPLIRLEQVTDTDRRMTVEFVRRTAGSGSALTYAVQFASDPGAGWQTGGTESVTAINERWERVKVTDDMAVGGAIQARFARVLASQDPPAPESVSVPANDGPVRAVSTKGSSER